MTISSQLASDLALVLEPGVPLQARVIQEACTQLQHCINDCLSLLAKLRVINEEAQRLRRVFLAELQEMKRRVKPTNKIEGA